MPALSEKRSEDFVWLNCRLDEWGHYARGMPVHLGFPRRNTLDRIRKDKEGVDGAGYVRGLPPFEPEWPVEIRETDRAVLSLPADLREVVHTKWIRGKNTYAELAKYFHTNENTIKDKLAKARHWLAGRLS